jgi:hypothetical protein
MSTNNPATLNPDGVGPTGFSEVVVTVVFPPDKTVSKVTTVFGVETVIFPPEGVSTTTVGAGVGVGVGVGADGVNMYHSVSAVKYGSVSLDVVVAVE